MKKVIFGFIFLLLLAATSIAQEGMWLLTQTDQLDLSKKGLAIQTSDLYNKDKPALYSAILQVGGGTGSFVSPDGLVLTNHHVAFTALQRASSTSANYLTDGFLARTRNEEIKAPGYRALMVVEIRDVTGEVSEAAKGITDPTEKDKKVNAKIASMTDLIEKDKKDIKARIAEMFNGKQYMLFVYKEFKDMRIVYAPPSSIGNYGGETDNWMWPRHTGDFSFLRIYAAPDGTGAEYDAQNIPYKPKVWLRTTRDNLKENDFTFIMGFPGFTTRYRTSTSVHWNQEYNYPFSIRNYSEIIELCDELTGKDPSGQLKVASLTKGLANAMKNYQGKLEGMKKTNFLQKKLDFEKEFLSWANSNPANKEKYSTILSREKEQYKMLGNTKGRDNVYSNFQGLAGLQLSMAMQIYYIAKEMEKPEGERQPGLTEESIMEGQEELQYVYADYYEPVDKALLVRALKMAGSLAPGQRIAGLEYILSDDMHTIDQFADNAVATSRLNDLEFVKSLYKRSSKDIEALNDPFIKMAVQLYPLGEELQNTNRVFAANVTDIRKEYLDALFAWKGKNLYPDANGTIRFTSGRIKGYKPRNAVWYDPFTSLKGVVEKNTGIEPFDAPEGLVALSDKRDFGNWMDPVLKDVPLAFLSTCDITGGNSGSPVMNAKGELIGVVFDGNYEAMISDWQYDPELQRAISCDIRYVLYITQKFGNAGFLVEEMQAVR
ncbi:MAG: S46 family peptidase [Bacteroidales bacterium]|nr:S46 family peptidase [Bacteroidales bacterium]